MRVGFYGQTNTERKNLSGIGNEAKNEVGSNVFLRVIVFKNMIPFLIGDVQVQN